MGSNAWAEAQAYLRSKSSGRNGGGGKKQIPCGNGKLEEQLQRQIPAEWKTRRARATAKASATADSCGMEKQEKGGGFLFDRDALCQVSRLVYVVASSCGYVVDEDLMSSNFIVPGCRRAYPGAKARVVVGSNAWAEAQAYLRSKSDGRNGGGGRSNCRFLRNGKKEGQRQRQRQQKKQIPCGNGKPEEQEQQQLQLQIPAEWKRKARATANTVVLPRSATLRVRMTRFLVMPAKNNSNSRFLRNGKQRNGRQRRGVARYWMEMPPLVVVKLMVGPPEPRLVSISWRWTPD